MGGGLMSDWREQLRKKAQEMGMKVTSEPETKKQNYGNGNIPENKKAHAPYNFVPLNKNVIPAKHPDFEQGHPTFDQYYPDIKGYNTGYIECELETLTPLYIRDTLDRQELAERKESKEIPDFFSPAGKIRIPGSSLRGMVRTLVEIVSWSKFGFFDDKNLYYRGLADQSIDSRDEYSGKMTSRDNKGRSKGKMSAGYLVKEGVNYFIIPAQKDEQGRQYRQIRRDNAQRICRKIGARYKEFSSYKLDDGYLVISGRMPNKKREWIINPKSSEDRIPVLHLDIESYRKDKNRVPEADLLAKLKGSRDEVPCFYVTWKDVDPDNKHEEDCKKRERVSFGHTGMFRIAYEKSIEALIPINSRENKKIIDISEAIFGKTPDRSSEVPDFAGRVFFEDASCHSKSPYLSDEEFVTQILATPNPTTFQHYLSQDFEKVKYRGRSVRGLKHYNSSNTEISGWKSYWHKKNGDAWKSDTIKMKESDWEEFLKTGNIDRTSLRDVIEIKRKYVFINLKRLKSYDENNMLYKKFLGFFFKIKNPYSKIKPIKPEVGFSFRIRFENLSQVELGALLFVLKLPPGCHHKLGMGKPLGLGSVKITPRLIISSRPERYRNLMEPSKDGGRYTWTTKEKECNFEAPGENPINCFVDHITKHEKLKEEMKGITNLWEAPRLKTLRALLNYTDNIEIPKWNERTDYMGLEEFKERKVLPRSKDVIK